jgi:hypothetical protein
MNVHLMCCRNELWEVRVWIYKKSRQIFTSHRIQEWKFMSNKLKENTRLNPSPSHISQCFWNIPPTWDVDLQPPIFLIFQDLLLLVINFCYGKWKWKSIMNRKKMMENDSFYIVSLLELYFIFMFNDIHLWCWQIENNTIFHPVFPFKENKTHLSVCFLFMLCLLAFHSLEKVLKGNKQSETIRQNIT